VLDTSALTTVAHCTTEPPPSSPVQGMALQKLPALAADEGAIVMDTATSTQDGGHQATSDPSDATPTRGQGCLASRSVCRRGVVEASVAPTCHSTKADGGNRETSANQE
jgi:hypothetical protein